VSLNDVLVRLGLKYIGFFEPLANQGISYFLNGQLKKYKKQGLISEYRTKTKRLGKWHYKIEVYLDASPRQFIIILKGLSYEIRKLVRR
jgi:hypothetical protein